jgi:hypothetical protein
MSDIDVEPFEVRQERFLRRVNMLMAEARILLRTFGPRVPGAADENLTIRRCAKCTPPPEMHTCAVCGASFEEPWRLSLHISTNPKWCQDAGAKRIREASRQA